MNQSILIVDDDKDIVRLISDGLEYEQFKAVSAFSGLEALEEVRSGHIDFVILDIMMPEMDGLDVCRTLRRESNVPILILSARDREMDKITGLEIGADDYMTKPFSVQELISRVKAHFRKFDRLKKEWSVQASQETNHDVTNRRLILNKKTYETLLDGHKIDLSVREFQILAYLSDHSGQVLSREQIYENVWGDEFGDINTITVHIKNIRKKMGENFNSIKTIWGIGYQFINEDNLNET
ncbi:response regulator transcription factor [Sporolactobacillus pectinivorans]|uniref:response regulator transcription factor n=1 Tax=Sporolactobacillus pectinivorans TaxID=1591408 RepID=UPI000C25C80B|nr:response regulator transcription factor [Sporolactobacillus pectinivorans]